MSTTSSEQKAGDRPKVPKAPKNAHEMFVVLAHKEYGCGGYSVSGSTFSPAVIRSPPLWPALLALREPTMHDIVDQDNGLGVLLRGFEEAAKIAFSTGDRRGPAIVNGWQLARIAELTASFRAISETYVNFDIIKTQSQEQNCQRFLSMCKPNIMTALSKRDQLTCDYVYKLRGPQAAKRLRETIAIPVTEWPADLMPGIKNATKPSFGRGRFPFHSFHHFPGKENGGGDQQQSAQPLQQQGNHQENQDTRRGAFRGGGGGHFRGNGRGRGSWRRW